MRQQSTENQNDAVWAQIKGKIKEAQSTQESKEAQFEQRVNAIMEQPTTKATQHTKK
jgi:hypothetical protein